MHGYGLILGNSKAVLRVHSSNPLIVCCNFLWIASRVGDLYIITKSSTQREHSIPGSTCFTILLILTLNKVVDKIAPCGTPS